MSAWNSNGTLSKEDARQHYVELVARCCPEWQPDCANYDQQGGPAGPVFSSLAHSKDCGEDLDAAAVCEAQAASSLLSFCFSIK